MDAVWAALERALGLYGPGALAFDADGTLWSGDVGDDLFRWGLEHELFRAPALPALQTLASEHSVALQGNAGLQAQSLFEAFEQGRLPARSAYEMMVWAFAGWSIQELHLEVDQMLRATNLRERLFEPLGDVIAWARQRALPCYVVSASPIFVIERAVRVLGFEPEHLAAGEPMRSSEGIIAPHLAAPLPYLDHKVDAFRRIAPGARLLCAFGDSGFDLPLLQTADLAVAVRPKKGLRDELHRIPRALLLE
ncbi:MAG TPA: haloacid dehalogenase-like hydrolase [Polyangiaceae bacterium]|nr:haloacid dehalogenase-like hydrolase [Polyangiaceae bacterium]